MKIRDLHSSLRIGHTLSSHAQSSASNILFSAKVQAWLVDKNSSVLVINGMERTGLMTHSTASYFSALLLVNIQKVSQETKTISWFCGQHVQETNLATMLANLVGQLLSEGLDGLGVEELQVPAGLPQRGCHNLTTLLIRYLRLQLRKTPVYCVVDSISWYEDFQRLQDLFGMWAELARLTRSMDPGSHPLKVLATSPSRCSRIGTQLDFTNPSVYCTQDETPDAYSMLNLMHGYHEVP